MIASYPSMLVDRCCIYHSERTSMRSFVLNELMVNNLNGEQTRVVGRNCAKISIPSNRGKFKCELMNVVSVPECPSNLHQSRDEWSGNVASVSRKTTVA